MNDKLVIRPGFPSDWKEASLTTPDVTYRLKRKDTDTYQLPTFRQTIRNRTSDKGCSRESGFG